MRRVIVVAAAIVGAVVIFAGAILFYAATNLNSIIAERRQTILDKVSTALGRQIHADDIKVSLGWGIMADVTGVQVADDPDISTKPFIEASNVYTRLQLMPLLARRIEVTEVVLDKPVIRIVQTRDGTFNVSTLGRKKVHTEEESGGGEGGGKGGGGENEESPMAEAGRAPAALGSLLVQNFSINDGTLTFQTEGAPESSTVNAIRPEGSRFWLQRAVHRRSHVRGAERSTELRSFGDDWTADKQRRYRHRRDPAVRQGQGRSDSADAARNDPDDCEGDTAEAFYFRPGQLRRHG